MATKRQLIPLLMEDLRKYSTELLEDDTFSLENDIDFESVLQDLLWDRGLCEGCRNWFSPERSCEKETESLRTCINRAYDYLLKEYGSKKSNIDF